MPNVDLSSLSEQIRQLPQSAHLGDRIRPWLQHLLEQDHQSGLSPERQVTRLGGFGGSEIGVLVAEQLGGYDPFDTAREICQRKLLLNPPQPADLYEPGVLQRGIDLEPLICQYFRQMSQATVLETPRDRLRQHCHRDHPWMRYTPDDVLHLHGLTVLVDYKAPFQPPTEIAFRYSCQLHQGRLLAEDAGIGIDRMLMVAWDLQRWRPVIHLLERDASLEQAIKVAGDHYWSWVERGKAPPWPQRTVPTDLALTQLEPAQCQQLEQMAIRYAQLDILAKEAKKAADTARDALQGLSRMLSIGDVQTGPVKLKSTQSWQADAIQSRLPEPIPPALTTAKWDSDKLVWMVRELGGDPEVACRERTVDLDKAAQWLTEKQNLPAALLQTPHVKASLSRRKADQATIEPLREKALDLIEQQPIAPPCTAP